jgi:thioredoxin reductase (NADPH)
LAAENVDFLWNSAGRALEKGDEGVLLTVENTKTGEQSRLTTDGVFVSIGRRPATALFREELLLDEEGYIVADETTKTNLPGVYAVGDVRQKPLRQIVTAVGDGAVAAHYAEEFLSGV